MLEEHFRPARTDDLTISERRFPFRVRADLQRAIDRLFADVAIFHFCGVCAGKAGLHRAYIGLLERCLRMPSIDVAQKVARALEVTMTVLVAELEGLEVEILHAEPINQDGPGG